MSDWKQPRVQVGDQILVRQHPQINEPWSIARVLAVGVDHVSAAVDMRYDGGDGQRVQTMQRTCWHETDPRIHTLPNAVGPHANAIWKASSQMDTMHRLIQENVALVKRIEKLEASVKK